MAIDFSALAVQVANALAPYVPYLTIAGSSIAEGAGQALEEEGGRLAKSLWEKLRPGVEDKPAAKEAFHDVAAAPENGEARVALQWQIGKMLASDPSMAAELSQLLSDRGYPTTHIEASGPRSIAVGGNITNSPVNFGDIHRG
jgi:hypothetical protein